MAPVGHATQVAPLSPHSASVLPVTQVPRSLQHPEQLDGSHVDETPHDTERRATASRMRIRHPTHNPPAHATERVLSGCVCADSLAGCPPSTISKPASPRLRPGPPKPTPASPA